MTAMLLPLIFLCLFCLHLFEARATVEDVISNLLGTAIVEQKERVYSCEPVSPGEDECKNIILDIILEKRTSLKEEEKKCVAAREVKEVIRSGKPYEAIRKRLFEKRDVENLGIWTNTTLKSNGSHVICCMPRRVFDSYVLYKTHSTATYVVVDKETIPVCDCLQSGEADVFNCTFCKNQSVFKSAIAAYIHLFFLYVPIIFLFTLCAIMLFHALYHKCLLRKKRNLVSKVRVTKREVCTAHAR